MVQDAAHGQGPELRRSRFRQPGAARLPPAGTFKSSVRTDLGAVNGTLTVPSHSRDGPIRVRNSRAIIMRSLLATIVCTALLGISAAQAEKRIFIIANNADGYGIDRCLASGERCGTAAATAYCKSREFAEAKSFRKVDKEDITGAIPVNSNECRGGGCDQFVAIECTR